jgi:class 3 adenylate cyclase/CheY-like chemotaxis protein
VTDSVRRLRHELLNQVNHIVGYAELLLEEGGDARLGDVVAAGKKIMSAVQLILGGDTTGGFDEAELRAALAGPLDDVRRLAASIDTGGDPDAERFIGQIAVAAQRSTELIGESTAAAPASEEEPAAGAVCAGEGERGVVLVVDDDEANREVLTRRLGRLGYAVRQAENGRVALEVMAGEPIDLVLLDLNMPEFDGYQVLEARHDDPRLRDIPTIMISASADTESVVRCIQMGADDHLGKPFDPVLLEARVGACLEKKRLRDQERELLDTVSHQAGALAEWNETLEKRVAEQVDELGRMARLRRFLSPQLADLLITKGDDTVLETHRRDIAVLFVDLSGFTAFSETSEPEDVMAVLREFHEELGLLVREFEATVGFFAGDGLMVFWNDPMPCPDPADRAVRMAVALRERFVPLTAGWRKRGHDLGFAVGVASGYATLGEIGFEGRYEYGVIGSVVNLASRLCDHAGRDQILISARAKLAVEDIAEFEEVGAVPLKGFHAPVSVFNVVGLRGER